MQDQEQDRLSRGDLALKLIKINAFLIKAERRLEMHNKTLEKIIKKAVAEQSKIAAEIRKLKDKNHRIS
ncbi:MAG: hypothetical protein NTZ10_03755 [Candidatus Saganbacteria bacterium]|nr:hypothetical protein [Candidatus Saganbacteria bacterium]